jgi:glycosyltransferase involved in cell wall biosynthesis
MFSICIPNYNYEKYLGLTLDSIFSQTCNEFEVTIADNCSTDSSVRVIEEYSVRNPGKIRHKVNPVNLGFSANLDQAASLATGDYLIMLSSDDRMNGEALAIYQKIIAHAGRDRKLIICASNNIIDSSGNTIRSPRAKDFRFNVWRDSDIDQELTQRIGAAVYHVSPAELLRRVLPCCTNPFNFLATAYHHSLYHEVGGYGGSRMINPDKWFHWRILAKAEEVFFIDYPLFEYRWHAQNQTAQQTDSGFLKYLADEYRNTIEITPGMLSKANLTATQFTDAFISHDIIRHGMGEFAKGRWLKSFRTFFFGLSTYPGRLLSNRYAIPYFLLLFTTPAGSYLLSRLLNKKRL